MDSNFWTGFLKGFQTGGPWMVAIAICFVTAIVLCVERFMRLYTQYSIDGASFMFEVQKHILANDLDGAIRVCNGAGRAALPKVIKAGLQRASRDDQQIQNAIDAASLEVIPKLERRIPYLALIANVATLFGLLGTINGLMQSFASIAQSDPSKKAEILSLGISEAMNATAFGLATAIFAMIAHSFLSSKSNRILDEIDEFGVKLLDLLSARKFRHTSQKD